MGHRAGWLALGAGIAGGADVILIPEIPVQTSRAIAAAIKRRGASGARTSASSPSPRVRTDASTTRSRWSRRRGPGRAGEGSAARAAAKAEVAVLEAQHTGNTLPARPPARAAHRARVARLDPRLHPARRHAVAVDRLLATRLGSAAADLVAAGTFGVDGQRPAATDDRRAARPRSPARARRVPADHAVGRRGPPRRDLPR